MRKVVHPDRQVTYIMAVETLISDCHQSNKKCLLDECAWTAQHRPRRLPEFKVKKIWNLKWVYLLTCTNHQQSETSKMNITKPRSLPVLLLQH